MKISLDKIEYKRKIYKPYDLIKLYVDTGANLDSVGGIWLIKQIYYWSRYKPLQGTSVNTSNFKFIGKGTYGQVYDYSENKVIKVTEPKQGKIEAQVMQYLFDNIVCQLYSPCIVHMYQYIQGPDHDYIIMEKLSYTLCGYIEKKKPSIKVCKGIILQVLFTLMILQTVIPGFRHNDIYSKNVLLDNTIRTTPFTFCFKKHKWVINENVPIIKLVDFDFTNIPKLINNPKIGTKSSRKYGATPEENGVYDMHLFLNTIYICQGLPKSVKKWIRGKIPSKILGHDKNKYIQYSRLKTPQEWVGKLPSILDLLVDPFFDSLRTRKTLGPKWGYYHTT